MVQSAICDKKVEIEREKLVEQAKNIAKPRDVYKRQYLFCGTDVAAALGYSNPRDAIIRHCRYFVKRDAPHPQSPDRKICITFIPEGDLYRLIVHSKLPSAERFERWVPVR